LEIEEERLQIVVSRTQHPDLYRHFLELQAIYGCRTYPQTLEKLIEIVMQKRKVAKSGLARFLADMGIELEYG